MVSFLLHVNSMVFSQQVDKQFDGIKPILV